MSEEGQREILILFDFDNTLVHDNTDTRPFRVLAPDLLESHFRNADLRKSLGWTSLVNKALQILCTRGITPSEVLSAVSTSHFPPQNVQLINSISRAPMTTSAILSDANEHYIDACLSANNLSRSDFAAGVFTNSSAIIDSKIVVTPYSTTFGLHTCQRCPPNLCKSVILKQLVSTRPLAELVYAGDGGNDYCPAASLPPNALVLPRKGYELEKRILRHPIAAKVCVWADAEELSAILREHVPALRNCHVPIVDF